MALDYEWSFLLHPMLEHKCRAFYGVVLVLSLTDRAALFGKSRESRGRVRGRRALVTKKRRWALFADWRRCAFIADWRGCAFISNRGDILIFDFCDEDYALAACLVLTTLVLFRHFTFLDL